MALDTDEMCSQASWMGRREEPLAPGAAFLIAVASSVFLWVLLISMGMGLLRLTGYWS
jgi:hypothetical protein